MTAPQLALFERPAMLRDAAPALASVPAASVITPRDYQLRADAAIDVALAVRRSTLVVAATGTGKTVLFAMQAKKRGGCLVVAHENSLIQQAAQKLRHVTGEYVAIEKAARRDQGNAKFVVGSMQSLRGDRLRDFAASHPWIEFIVIDEAHRALAKSYRDILAAFPNAKVLGVTATADRGDKKALSLVFEKADTDHGAAFKYDIADATADAWLTHGDWYPLDVSGVSLDDVSVKGGELDQDELDAQVAEQAGQIAQAVVQHCKGEPTLVFTPGVKTAIVGAEAINRLVPGAARAIHGGSAAHGPMSDDEKAQIKAAHARGEFPYLLNCQMLIEGYDDPRLLNVVMLSKTKSRARWAQTFGRGGRLWPFGIDHLATVEERRAAIAASPKPRFKFFDANYGKHGHTLAGPIDLLGGRYDDEVKARAKKNLEAQGGGDVAAALEEAAQQIEAVKAKKLAALAAKAARAKGQVLVGPARAACELFGVAQDMGVDDDPRGEPVDSVVAWLVEKGVKNAEAMGPSAARTLKAKLKERQKLGFATFKMVNALKRSGVEKAAELTFNQAGKLMGVLSGKPWGWQFTPGHVAQLLGRPEPGWDG